MWYTILAILKESPVRSLLLGEFQACHFGQGPLKPVAYRVDLRRLQLERMRRQQLPEVIGD